MTTPAELLRAFHSINSSRKARPLKIVEEELCQQEGEEEGEQLAESV